MENIKEVLREIFDYRDGKLFWKINAGNSRVGDRAGSPVNRGYRRIVFMGTKYVEHRLIWMWHNGEIPDGLQIDHIDQNTEKNLIENLRAVTPRENTANSDRLLNSASALFGVQWNLKDNRWRASISAGVPATVNLGTYDSEIEAARAVNIFFRDNKIDRFNNVEDPFKTPMRRLTRGMPNTYGQRGVTYSVNENKYLVSFKLDGKKKRFGRFDTCEEAVEFAKYLESKGY